MEQENERLAFILSKYDMILKEYQRRYGDELYLQLDNSAKLDGILISGETVQVGQEEVVSVKRQLINNMLLIKEYESKIRQKDEEIKKLKTALEIKGINSQTIIEQNYVEETNEVNHLRGAKTTGFVNQEEILRSKEEVEEYKTKFSEMKEKYDKAMEFNKNFEDNYTILANENEKLKDALDKYKNTVDELNEIVLNQDRAIQKEKKNVEKIDVENNSYKKQNATLKETFEESQKRKDAEINSLKNTNSELKDKNKDLKYKSNLKDEEISSLKFQMAQLKQENTSLKFDRDHLTKILEDSNNAVQAASEKEKHVDDLIREYKRKAEDANLEVVKLNQKIKMQEAKISNYSNECANMLKEKGQNYENLFNLNKSKYEEIIRNKNEEISNLKAENLANKIEKDKYINENKIIQSEYNKIKDNYNSGKDSYLSKYEESQQKLNATISKYEEELNQYKIKADELENQNKMQNDELRTLRESDKLKDTQIFNYMKNDSLLNDELRKAKEKISFFSKQNENLSKENQRINGLYETKIKNMNKEFDIKVITLENTIQYQKDKLSLIEGKAFDMLKKQENLTNKFKNEYFKTIEYYENLIGTMNGNQNNERENTFGNTAEAGVGVSGNFDVTPNKDNNNDLKDTQNLEDSKSDSHF